MKMIDTKQKQLIHVAKQQVGLSDDEYRELLQIHYKTTTCKQLTYFEADRLINYFKKLGFRIKKTQTTPYPRQRGRLPGNVVMLVSVAQLGMIEALKREIKWEYADGYDRWLKKYLKAPAVRTSKEAWRVIEGLKGLLRNQGVKLPHTGHIHI